MQYSPSKRIDLCSSRMGHAIKVAIKYLFLFLCLLIAKFQSIWSYLRPEHHWSKFISSKKKLFLATKNLELKRYGNLGMFLLLR